MVEQQYALAGEESWPRWPGWMTGWHPTRSFPNAGTCTGTLRCRHWPPETSLMLAAALAHLVAGRSATAVDLLSRLGAPTERLGGVRVEREIICDTLARALVDVGEPDRAAHLLHDRIHTRHHHNYEHHPLIPRHDQPG